MPPASVTPLSASARKSIDRVPSAKPGSSEPVATVTVKTVPNPSRPARPVTAVPVRPVESTTKSPRLTPEGSALNATSSLNVTLNATKPADVGLAAPVRRSIETTAGGVAVTTSEPALAVVEPPSSSSTVRLTRCVPGSRGMYVAMGPPGSKIAPEGAVTVQIKLSGSRLPAASEAVAVSVTPLSSTPLAGTLTV